LVGGVGGGGKIKAMASDLTKNAKKLRRNPTRAESLLWNKIRAKQIEGIKFRRQQPIGNYIVDFVSFEKKIIIELDGGQHAKAKKKDSKRDKLLTENGFTVLRFWNNDIFNNLEGVLEVISKKCI
jgi:very-short-patch-repair endonuclease